jgi:hypothetical protein
VDLPYPQAIHRASERFSGPCTPVLSEGFTVSTRLLAADEQLPVRPIGVTCRMSLHNSRDWHGAGPHSQRGTGRQFDSIAAWPDDRCDSIFMQW